MLVPVRRLAVYTTIYPGAETYLQDWYSSVLEQTDQNFELWIGLDGISIDEVESTIGFKLDAVVVPSRPDSTPALVRKRALEGILDDFDAVVLVDCDDILDRTRVGSARAALQESELTACALRLVDRDRQDLGKTLTPPEQSDPEDILPRKNVFGFSNSAYRSGLLRRCLPLPPGVELIDWYMATKAWLVGAKLAFDRVARMEYRQHSANTAPIRFPFDVTQVCRDTDRVKAHFSLLQTTAEEDALPDRWIQLQQAAEDVQLFSGRIVSQPERLKEYVRNLNSLEPQTVWWWHVAQTSLGWMWRNSDENGL